MVRHCGAVTDGNEHLDLLQFHVIGVTVVVVVEVCGGGLGDGDCRGVG